jgi:hypothetical protein
MKLNSRLLESVLALGVVALAVGACAGPTTPNPTPSATTSATPSASASPSSSPVAIGDGCLVGNWMLVDEKTVLANNNGSVEGGAGAKLTLAASGKGSIDFTASAPASGTAGGSSVSVLDSGSVGVVVLASNGSLTLSVTDNKATVTVTQGGVASAPQAYVDTPGAYTYTCSAKSLTLNRSVVGDQETLTFAKA